MQSSTGRGYYAGKTILLTGATGLVGKALIEAILRKLPEVGRVYVLIRARTDAAGRTVSVARRFREEVLASSAFDELRAQHGEGFEAFVHDKVEAVGGELSRERLGLAPELYRRLQEEVDVVIGNGALAVFDAPLDQAVHTNALGPQRILDFARGAAKRPFVAHVSTCYVSNVAGPVFEAPLPPDWTPAGPDAADPYDVDRELERLLAHVGHVRSGDPSETTSPWWQDLLTRIGGDGRPAGNGSAGRAVDPGERAVTQRLVNDGLRWARRRGWRDTYTFTKAMGEQLFARHGGDVPGLILRPSVIESALATPTPGWIDGYRMLDPLIVGFARRQLTEFPGNPEAVLDVVPVDVVVNALLMAIPYTHGGEGPDVYQVASGTENPLLVKEFRDYVREHYQRAPLRRARAGQDDDLPELAFPAVGRFLRGLEYGYLLPVRALEAAYRPLAFTNWGRKRRATLSARRARLTWLRDMAEIYGPYGESRARFLTYNVRRAWRALPAAERAAFPFDVRALDWKRYVQEVHLPGVERYLLGLRGRRAAPVALSDDDAAAGGCPASVAADAGTHGEELEPEVPRGARSNWRRAEQVLTLTRATSAAEATTWTTPTYKRLIRWASIHAIHLVARLRLELAWDGREHVPERGPFIVVSNHTSHVDTGVLLAALGPHASHTYPTAAADYWFSRPAVAWLLHATLGGIPFDRHRPNVARALALPAQVLRNGHSLIFYPEGTRSPDGTLQPFRSTVGLLALASAAPIVPAYVTGAAQALPKGHAVIAHHPVHVRFGPPTPIEAYLARLDYESVSSVSRRLAQDTHAAVARLAPPGALPAGEARP
ncbi:MAG: SDR family oxidoreductase [Trueperaceae bacterium]|nr:SDR family oxidoreductase [Trueperaceae bacterium]